ncbi:uncharacterized protein LOC127262004 isoform X2 [Andrographis paniculata]|nr:uncharacterized protein LOC127262004 isoform X2 [Andrographis paniculata]
MISLSGRVFDNENSVKAKSLLALAAGIKQKNLVNEIVRKFFDNDFVVMIFHYDGIVDRWRDLEWSDRAVHVSAMNQTKWWFAKRFLHPDLVAEYEYVFLWDEDLGVENFRPGRYLSIIREEGLEISQPALDPGKSKVHHRITVRNRRIRVHRRYYRAGRCEGNSTAPPCAGWVEMMAPVFSRAAWRCTWHMIQNDLIHAWGLDMQLGYCAQGDRAVKVGIVDAEYISHLGLPTLGTHNTMNPDLSSLSGLAKNSSNSKLESKSEPESESSMVTSTSTSVLSDSDNRQAIRQRSYAEMRSFANRWKRAVEEDACWIDPFRQIETE